MCVCVCFLSSFNKSRIYFFGIEKKTEKEEGQIECFFAVLFSFVHRRWIDKRIIANDYDDMRNLL